jgi:5-methylcytosine-specific restriction endonuclease McrA
MALKDDVESLRSAGKSYKEIAEELDCSETTVGYWARKSSLPRIQRPRRSNHFDKDVLESATAKVTCWSDLCKELGKSRSAALHVALREQIENYGIDVSHFIYSDPRVSPATRRTKGGRTLDQMLNSRSTKSDDLRKKLISEGVKNYECESCRLTEWLGKPIPLELDHIDGDHFNNSLDNLRILCPNCHSQTPHHRVPFRLRKKIVETT